MHPALRKLRTHHGFTLVELLVVVGIIALLTAFLLPTLKQARDSAQFVACRSNLRQIAGALQMYANDNRDHFPDPISIGDGDVSAAAYYRRGVNWPDETDPTNREQLGLPNMFWQRGYLRSGAVWICPATSDLNRTYGNSYIVQISRTTAGYTTKQRAANPDVFYVYDNYLYKTPQSTNVPRSVGNSIVTFPNTQWTFPHRYLGRVKGSEASNGKGRQGAVNMLYQDNVVGIVTYLDKGSSAPVAVRIRG